MNIFNIFYTEIICIKCSIDKNIKKIPLFLGNFSLVHILYILQIISNYFLFTHKHKLKIFNLRKLNWLF